MTGWSSKASARDERRDAPGRKVLKDRRSPPPRGRMGTISEPELVDVYVRAVRDQPHERVLRKQRQRPRERLLQRAQFLLDEAHVHDEEIRGRRRRRSLQRVLDGRVRGKQLRGKVRLAYRRVVRREVVPRVTERTYPQLAVEVHARVRVQTRGAAFASHRVVGHDGHVREGFSRGHHRAEGDDALRRLRLAVRPDVPGGTRRGWGKRREGRGTIARGTSASARRGRRRSVDRSVRSEALSVGASARRASAGGATRRVAHHDSRTPSTASSAPQSGVCIARVWSSPPSLLDPSRRRGDAPRRRAGASWMPPRDPRPPTFVARLARANRTRDALLATPPSTRSRVLALAKDARAAVRCDPRTANATSRGAHCARRRGLGLDGDDGCLMMSARTSEGDLLDDETRRAPAKPQLIVDRARSVSS
eukprot:31366-Pelagococcus_subviridis.AAC.1